MSEFPKAMYKAPGDMPIHGFMQDFCVVADQQEQDDALSEGWFLTSQEAQDAHGARKSTQETVVHNGTSGTPPPPSGAEASGSTPASDDSGPTDEDAGGADDPPTRDELERKARELGIKFDGRTTDKKLSAAIQALVKA